MSIFSKTKQDWTSLIQFLASIMKFEYVWTSLNHFGQVLTIFLNMNKFEQALTSSPELKAGGPFKKGKTFL